MEKIILLVLVTIAKVIGILLAVLVIVALAILFAAVRYCGKISFDDKKAQISIRWLGVVLRVPILITDKDLQWKVRVFGVPILRSDGAHKKRRSKKSSAPKAQKRKAQKEAETDQKTQGRKTELTGSFHRYSFFAFYFLCQRQMLFPVCNYYQLCYNLNDNMRKLPVQCLYI